jgi:predicted nucleotidyltransferase
MLGLLRNVIPKYTEKPAVARKKQQEYKAKVWSGRIVSAEKLKAIVDKLGLTDYAIFGGNAAIHYGAQRTTVDVDILMTTQAASRLQKSIHPAPKALAIGGFTFEVDGVRVDIVHGHEANWLTPAMEDANESGGVRFVSRVWLAVFKMIALRGDVDLLDTIAAVRGMAAKEVAQSRKLIKRFCPNEVEDFETIVELAKLPVDQSLA